MSARVVRAEVLPSLVGRSGWDVWVTLAGGAMIYRSTHRTEIAAWRAVGRAVGPFVLRPSGAPRVTGGAGCYRCAEGGGCRDCG